MEGLNGLELLGEVNAKYVASAANTQKKERSALLRYVLPIAAALFIIIAAAALIANGAFRLRGPNNEQQAFVPVTDAPGNKPTQSGENVSGSPSGQPTPCPTVMPIDYPTPMPTAAPDPFFDRESHLPDQMGKISEAGEFDYFIYHGKTYIALVDNYGGRLPAKIFDLKGPMVARITYIDLMDYCYETPPAQNTMIPGEEHDTGPFRELTGSFEGPVYELIGYDPEYVLCHIWPSGDMTIYFSGAGAVTGADLFETRLHMREHLSTFMYDGYVRSGDKRVRYDTCSIDPAENAAVTRFLDALDAAEWVESQSNERSDALVYLYIMLEDGMRIELTVDPSGCVRLVLFYSEAMLRLDPEDVSGLIELLVSGEGTPACLPEYDIAHQLANCRAIEGFGDCIPGSIPEGYHIGGVGAFPEAGSTEIASVGIAYLADQNSSVGMIDVTIRKRSSYEADPVILWAPGSINGEPVPAVPLSQFTVDDIHDSLFQKAGSEHDLCGTVICGDYVVSAYSSYIINDEIGSQEWLADLIEAMYALLTSVGQ
ncbi:MAG: PT domain-containing protein [Clostridia bacterium]|nr:PT domain-containing protein [Clostridia bacterium]